jgi:hypothetical protein
VPTAAAPQDAPPAGDPPAAAATAAPAGPILDVAVDARLDHGSRVLLVHGRAEAEARVGWLGGRFHQLRCAEPFPDVPQGAVVEVRRLGDDELLGEATVLDPGASRHGPTNDALVRLAAIERGEAPREDASIAPPPLDAEALALEERYAAAGAAPPADADLTTDERAALFALREAGRVVLLERGRHVHVDFAPS